MNIQIQTLHFDADKKLIEFVKEKVGKLANMYDGIVGSEVIMRIDNSSDTENKVAEIKLFIRGNDLFAKKQCKTFEEAIDLSVEAVGRQVLKHKEKVRGYKFSSFIKKERIIFGQKEFFHTFAVLFRKGLLFFALKSRIKYNADVAQLARAADL